MAACCHSGGSPRSFNLQRCNCIAITFNACWPHVWPGNTHEFAIFRNILFS
jgi:hypothetical protein